MKIGELAAAAALKPSAIRYYESVGLLEPLRRVGGQRRYSSEAIPRLQLIRLAGEMGFTLSEIRGLLGGPKNQSRFGLRWKKLARNRVAQIDRTIRRSRLLKSLLEELFDCHCDGPEACLKRLGPRPLVRALRQDPSSSRIPGSF